MRQSGIGGSAVFSVYVEESMSVRIIGTGSAVPKLRVTNEDLSRILDTSDEWIYSRTGIKARHIAVEETTAQLAAEAAGAALSMAQLAAEDIDLIIGATATPDRLLPGLACEVQRILGAAHAAAFDINAACSGFLFALNIVNAYLRSGVYQNALIIGAETLSRLTDWTDRGTCVLFGDGAGAAVVAADGAGETRGILGMVQGSDGGRGMVLSCGNRPLNNPYVNHGNETPYVDMNGQEVYKFAVKTVPTAIAQAVEAARLTVEEIDLFLLHQANYRIIEAAAKRLGQPMEKFPTNMQERGNISAASVPILLDEVNRCGKIKEGDKIVLAGFGAGLTWGAAVLAW